MKFSFFLSVATLAPFAFADEPAFIDDVSYAQGKLGAYPVSTYLTTDFVSPRVNKISTSSRCNQGLYTMLTPRGHAVEHPGPIILDDDGNLVWTKNMEGYGQSYGLTVQKYKGQDFLTFWAGDDGVGGHGAGYYYMVNSQSRYPKGKSKDSQNYVAGFYLQRSLQNRRCWRQRCRLARNDYHCRWHRANHCLRCPLRRPHFPRPLENWMGLGLSDSRN